MTILQLKYVIELANSGSMREASGKLFISQPALSSAIRELENELNIVIFERNNKGISITKEGIEFLTFAKQAVNQFDIIENRYIEQHDEKKHFTVTMQHYLFAVNAFVNTIKKCNYSKYVFSVYESRTEEVLNDVRKLKSEIGVISYTNRNEKIIKKIIKDYQLEFYPLMKCDTYAYMCKKHPLAGSDVLSLEDLKAYPIVTFDQSGDSTFYLNEEAFGDYDFDMRIKTNDRGSSVDILRQFNGYSIGTGTLVESEIFNNDFVSIKLKEEEPITVGYIIRNNHKLSSIGKKYIQELEKYKSNI